MRFLEPGALGTVLPHDVDPWPAPWTAEAIIRELEPLVLERRRQRFRDVFAARIGSVTLLLDELYDPHNRAAIVRSCDAFGVHELHALQRDGQFEIQRSIAAGCERWVSMHRHHSVEAAVEVLNERGYELVATAPDGELTPPELAGVARLALILGNEHRGVDPVLVRAAKRSVRIPMIGFVQSLNVSVSAAILLQAATSDRAGDLPLSEQRRMYARALFGSVPRAARVLDALRAR